MLLNYIKRSLNATICYSASSLFVRGVNFLILPYFLTQLTLAEFGIWDFYQLFFTLGGLLIAGAPSHMLTRYFVLNSTDSTKQKQAVGNACLVASVIALITCIGGISTLWAVGSINNTYAVCTIMSSCLWSLFYVALSYMRVREWLWFYAFLFSGQALIATLITVAGIIYGFHINAFFYANLISCALLVPSFFVIFWHYRAYSFSLLKEQSYYAMPVVIQSIGYMGFFTLDRLVLKYGAGYEALGSYALLWRFGALFQFFSLALLDAWFIMIYNAHKEEKSDYLLAKLMSFFTILLASGSLLAMAGSRVLISFLFPGTYHDLIIYLPFFFVSLTTLEIARLMQAGSFLSIKTRMLPAITAGALTTQAILLLVLYRFGLWGIFTANTLAFCVYAIGTAWQSRRVYPTAILPAKRLLKIISCFLTYTLVLNIAFYYYAPWYYLAALAVSWPGALWLANGVEPDEKTWLYEQYRLYIKPLLRKA